MSFTKTERGVSLAQINVSTMCSSMCFMKVAMVIIPEYEAKGERWFVLKL